VCDIDGKARSEERQMDDPMIVILAAASKIGQPAVITMIIVSTIMVLGLLVLIGFFAWRTKDPDGPLLYGNFFIVSLGTTTALIGFLVAFPLLISDVFKEPTQVIALLSGLFGTIVGLVGTYFGVKASSDATKQAHQLASDTITSDTTPPTVTSVDPRDRASDVPPDTDVSATFSKDMNRATINEKTFKLLDQVALTPIAGSVDYNVTNRVATFNPSGPLENGKVYQAIITAGARDQAGNSLAEDRVWHFTVVPEADENNDS
jgi:hypothetical protein